MAAIDASLSSASTASKQLSSQSHSSIQEPDAPQTGGSPVTEAIGSGQERAAPTLVKAGSKATQQPWDKLLGKVRTRLTQLSFALLSVQTLEAERVGWGAVSAAAASSAASASSSSGSSSAASMSALATARNAISKHRAELVVLLEQMLDCGKALPACDPEVAAAPTAPEANPPSASAEEVPSGATGAQASAAASSAATSTDQDEEEEDDWDCFCAKCKSTEETDMNPILLCDHEGCGRAFHRLCCAEPMSLEDLEDEDEPWVCDYCSALSEALSLIVEVDPDVDRDTVPELIGALREAAAEETLQQATDEEDEDEDTEAARMRKIAIASAAGQAEAEPREGAGRKRQQIDYAMLNALMFGEASGYDESEDVDYIGAAAGGAHGEDNDEYDDDDNDDDEEGDEADSLIDDETDVDTTRTARQPRRAAATARAQIRDEVERLEQLRGGGTASSARGGDTIASAVLPEDDEDDASFVEEQSDDDDGE